MYLNSLEVQRSKIALHQCLYFESFLNLFVLFNLVFLLKTRNPYSQNLCLEEINMKTATEDVDYGIKVEIEQGK